MCKHKLIVETSHTKSTETQKYICVKCKKTLSVWTRSYMPPIDVASILKNA